MSKSKTIFSISFLTLILTILFTIIAATQQPTFHRSLNPTSLGLTNEKKFTHFHFFLHQISSSNNKNTTTVTVAESPITTNATLHAALRISDYPLTVESNLNSTLVGKALGVSAYALSPEDDVMWTALNLEFTDGIFNGSTLNLLGRKTYPITTVREVPVVGGSGALWFASGYALVKPPVFSINFSVSDAVEEYDVYVFHY